MTDSTEPGGGGADAAPGAAAGERGSVPDSGRRDGGASDRRGRRRVGRAVAVERLPAAEVPPDYPADIGSEEALAVGVEFEGPADADGPVYYEWPPADDGPLERILDLRDVWQDRVEDLEGERVPVEVVDGHAVPIAPGEAPHGSPIGFYGLLVGVGGNLVVLGGLLAGAFPPSMSVGTTLLLLNFVLLPASTYLDGWYLRTRTDWEGNPLLWAALSGFVGLNVLVVGVYLRQRRAAGRY